VTIDNDMKVIVLYLRETWSTVHTACDPVRGVGGSLPLVPCLEQKDLVYYWTTLLRTTTRVQYWTMNLLSICLRTKES